MKKLLLSILLLSSFSFSKEYNFYNLLELDGLWTKKFSTEIANGKVYKMYGENKVYIGQIKNGKMNGEWTDWYESGKKKSEEKYNNGKRIGKRITWGENGQKYSEATYKDGEHDGLATIWYENGQKQLEATLKDGEQDGLTTMWDGDGLKFSEELYSDGKLMDKKLWKMDGNLKNYRITDSLLVVDYYKLTEIDEYIPVKPPYEINIYAHDVMWYNVIIDDSVNSTGFLSVDDSISFSFDNSLFLRVSDCDGALFLNNETVKAFGFRRHPTDFIFFNEYDEVHIIKYLKSKWMELPN